MSVALWLGGTREVADLLHVSRQRADQIVRTKGFPDPVAELTCGRIWDMQAVSAWFDAWNRAPGPKPKLGGPRRERPA